MKQGVLAGNRQMDGIPGSRQLSGKAPAQENSTIGCKRVEERVVSVKGLSSPYCILFFK